MVDKYWFKINEIFKLILMGLKPLRGLTTHASEAGI